MKAKIHIKLEDGQSFESVVVFDRDDETFPWLCSLSAGRYLDTHDSPVKELLIKPLSSDDSVASTDAATALTAKEPETS